MISGCISHHSTTDTTVTLSVLTDGGTSIPIPVLSFNKGVDELTIQSKYAEEGIRLHPEGSYYYKEASQEYYRILHTGYLQAIGVNTLKHTDIHQRVSIHSVTNAPFMRMGPILLQGGTYQVTFVVESLDISFPLTTVNPRIALPLVSRKYTYANGVFTAVDRSISLGAVSEIKNLVTSTHVNAFLRARQMYGILLIDLTTKQETYLVHENEEVFTLCTGAASEGKGVVASTLDDIIAQTESFKGTPL